MLILWQFQSEGSRKMQNELWKEYSMYEIRKNEKKDLIGAYNKIGVCLLLYFILSLIILVLFAMLLYIPSLNSFFQTELGDNIASTIINIICLVLPFWLLKSKKSYYEPPTVMPLKTFSAVKYLFLGFGTFYVANFASSFLENVCNSIGIRLSQPDFSLPASPVAAFVFFIRMTLVAGIFEELLFRGAVLGNLRRFGDKTAILVSAFLFAIFHGNLIQAPFAFVLGLYLGYVACKTGNIVYPIFIHATNNGIAAILTFFSELLSEQVYFFVGAAYAVISIGLLLLGLVLELLSAQKENELKKEAGIFTVPQKFGFVFASVPIIVLVVVCLIITANYISFGPIAS
jgi:membrane protease YdiL (CAAX protease family)